jgi:surface antigen
MNEQQQMLIAAFHDRELDNERVSAAQELLERSTGARAYLEELRRADQLLHSAFDPVLRESIPARLLPQRQRQGPWRYAMPLALAASLAVLAVFVVRQMDSDQQLRDQLILMQQEIAQLRHQALENTPSGTPVSWTAPKGKFRAQVTPLKTYRTADNKFCREYEERVEDKQGVEVRRGIACRAGKALWPDRQGLPPAGAQSVESAAGKGVNL